MPPGLEIENAPAAACPRPQNRASQTLDATPSTTTLRAALPARTRRVVPTTVLRHVAAQTDPISDAFTRFGGRTGACVEPLLVTSSECQNLETRLTAAEDRLAIYTLIASHPPSADTAAANYTHEVYVEDGVFDRGPQLEGARGVDAIAAFTLKPEHERAIRGGLAHFSSLPLIDLHGDEAIVTSYIQIVHLDHNGQARELSNHGTSQGYRIHRVVANRWQLVKIASQWKIRSRTILPIDGSDEALSLLSNGLSGVMAAR